MSSISKALPKNQGAPYLLTVDDLDRLPEPTWQLRGILQQCCVALLYGEPDVGKSFVALDIALSIATGTLWLGRTVERGDILYIAAEGQSGLKKRVAAWRIMRGVKPERATWRAMPCDILNKGERSELIHQVKDAGWTPKLVVVDTLARCFGSGDENSTQAMNAFVAGLDEIRSAFSNASVLVIHHSGKDRSRRDRGNSALRGAVDVVMKLERKSNVRVLTCEKMKDAEAFEPISFRLEQVRLANGDTSCVLASAVDADKSDSVKMNANDAKALAALDAIDDEERWRDPPVLTHGEWLKATGLARGTLGHCRNRLIGTERVVQDGNGYKLMPRAA